MTSKICNLLKVFLLKPLLLITLVSGSVWSVAAPRAAARRESAPVVYMPLTERHFGDVFAGEELDQVFPIRNDGDAPLEMDNKALTSQVREESPHFARAE